MTARPRRRTATPTWRTEIEYLQAVGYRVLIRTPMDDLEAAQYFRCRSQAAKNGRAA